MNREDIKVVCDRRFRLEAYYFKGIARPFPEHFHPNYVIGLVESGERRLLYRQQTYTIRQGDIVLFNPGDSHACTQRNGVLDYRGLHITAEMLGKLTGKTPYFVQPVIPSETLFGQFCTLHESILCSPDSFSKEALSALVNRLLDQGGQVVGDVAVKDEVEKACAFIKQHYTLRITLEQICRYTGVSKSTLLRAFVREKGITPYRYLENIRIDAAKKLLEQGVPPIETAARTGFFDQSHFTNYFTRFIGLSPGAYQAIFVEKRTEDGTEQ